MKKINITFPILIGLIALMLCIPCYGFSQISACDSILFNGTYLTQSGNYTNYSQLGNDIDGEAAGDFSGLSVSLSSDGNIVAIGALNNDDNGSNSGHVRIYSFDEISSTWNQLGNDIDGEAAGDQSGRSISLSSDGMTVAIGAAGNDGNGTDAGHVRIYSFDEISSTWNQLGNDIDGEAANDKSGYSVSLASDGRTVAIGARQNDGNGTDAGHVRIYSFDTNNNSWNQLGDNIDGEATNNLSGGSVSLASDGRTVAIGAFGNNGNGFQAGHTRIYSYDAINGTWNQLGTDIDGEAPGDGSGYPVSLASDVMTVAIGAFGNDGNGFQAGHVRIYSYDAINGTWIQLGNDIDGEAALDQSGRSVSLSSDGMTVAIGAAGNTGNGNNSGHTRIYYYDDINGTWNQLGGDIDAEAAVDNSGWSISLSSDGLTIAIGAFGNDGNGAGAGHTRVYSLESLDLTINNSSTGTDLVTACDTYTWIDGNTYTVSNNTASHVLTNAVGCDSTVTLDLTINNSSTGTDAVAACDSYTWIDGNTYTTSNNTATHVLPNVTGCDSTVTLNLTINHSSSSSDIVSSTDNYTWNGTTYNQSGAYSQLFTNQATCDSTHTIYLHIIESDTACDSLLFNGTYLTQSGNYTNYSQLGNDIDGEAADDKSGTSVSLSSDGKTVAIGAYDNDGNGTDAGQTRIYSYDDLNGTWNQLGNDIDGEAAGDLSGTSVSLSSDGKTVAIDAYDNDGNGTDAGHVRIYSFNDISSTWIQLGADIDGEAVSDRSGTSVSLSSDGNIVAIGAPYNDENGTNAGHVRIYSFDDISSTWNQLGTDIDGEAVNDFSGYSSLSSDGRTVAIGARYNDGNGANAGHVRIYSFDDLNGTWNQLGTEIDGEAAGDESGYSVSLSSDGRTVAIGAYFNNGNGLDAGHVRIYSYDDINGTWDQLGADIDGEAVGDRSGRSVSLSSDGNTVAIGAYFNNGNGTKSGHVRIYSYDDINGTWGQLGADINGEAVNDFSGIYVSLSSDGMTVAIGAPYNDGNGANAGHVRIYSLESLDLTIKNSSTATDAVTACDTYTWIDGNTYTVSNNTATQVLTNAVGCDSTVTLDLTINNSSTATDAVTACDTYTWIDGNTYTVSNNTATQVLTNAVGCDSTVTLDLTINNSSTATDAVTACDTYTWIDGNTYTVSNNTATHVLTNAVGCDSTVTLDLTINNSSIATDAVTACDTYTWIDGNTYTSSNNTATHVLTNISGCDSLILLDLTIDLSPSINITLSNGILYATPGLISYQWLVNGQVISGATNDNFTPITNGIYTCLSYNGLCDSLSDAVEVFLSNIHDTNFDYVGIHPNPANEYINIDLGKENLKSIQLLSVSGQLIANLDPKKRDFFMGNYARGFYFIELKNKNKHSVVKIILK